MGDRKTALRAEIEAARRDLLDAIHTMADADWDRPTVNPLWTARDILTHLANAEPGLVVRMRRILSGSSELPADFDLHAYNRRLVEKRRGSSVAELVASLEASRGDVIQLIDELADEQLDVRGWNARREEATVANILEDLARHEREHARDILSARS